MGMLPDSKEKNKCMYVNSVVFRRLVVGTNRYWFVCEIITELY